MNRLNRYAALILLLACQGLSASTIHAVYLMDMGEPERRQGRQILKDQMESFLQHAARESGMSYQPRVIQDKDFTAATVRRVLEGLRPGKEDMIFFMYHGHGYNGGTSKWPGFAVKDDRFGLADVIQILNKKDVRFVFAFSDSCNITAEQYEEYIRNTRSRTMNNPYKTLFGEFRGRIYASSSIKGQYSFSGYFIKQLGEALGQGVNAASPSWQAIMKHASRPIPVRSSLQSVQQPQFEIHPGSGPVVSDNSDESDESDEAAEEDEEEMEDQPVRPNPQREESSDEEEEEENDEEASEDEEEEGMDAETCRYAATLQGPLDRAASETNRAQNPGRNRQAWQQYRMMSDEIGEIAEFFEDRPFTNASERMDNAWRNMDWVEYRAGLSGVQNRLKDIRKECR